MDDLLFLSHRIPYPPNKGDKIRSWHILDYLAARYRVHLGCFVDDPDDWQHVDFLRSRAAECHVVALHPWKARLRGLAGTIAGAPITLGYFRDRSMAGWVRRLADGGTVRRVFVFSSSMAQYVMGPEWSGVRRVFDFVDVDSDKWRQYAAGRRGPARYLYAREARALLTFERQAAAVADASLFVSPAEAELFRRLLAGGATEEAAAGNGAVSRVAALSNGVDGAYFDPDRAYPDPYPAGGPVLVFTGALDYWANVDAVVWFARDILPLIRQRRMDARLYIVGANPTSEVRALAELAGVTVTGRVPDIRPYIAHAAIAVAPLRLARGVQNKVLEAMAMAKPIVATSQALEGIAAEPGRELLAADDAQAFANRTIELLARDDRDDMGRAARRTVMAAYDWGAHLSRLPEMLEPVRFGSVNRI